MNNVQTHSFFDDIASSNHSTLYAIRFHNTFTPSQYNNLDFEYLRQSHSKKYRHFYTLQPHARKYYLKHQLFVFLFPHYRGQPFHHISQGCLKTSTLTSHIYLHLFNSSNNQSYKSNFDWNFNRSGPIPFPRGGCVGRGPRPAVIRAGTRPR